MADFSSLSGRTIKVTHNGETRRKQLVVPAGATSNEVFATIRATAATLFETSGEGVWLLYSDEEGDLCTLTEHSVTDLIALMPEGTLRLTMDIRTAEVPPADGKPSTEGCDSTAIGKDPDSCPTPSCTASGSSVPTNSTDDALRSRIRNLLHKIPTGVRGLALNVVQGMDPAALQGMVRMFMEQKSSHAEHIRAHFNSRGEDAEKRMEEVEQIIPQLLNMEAEALKTLIMEELQSLSSTAGGENSCNAQQPNPFETLLGGICGSANVQAAGATPQQNPLGHLIGAALSAAGKSMGKGTNFANSGAQGRTPWADGAGFPQGGNPGEPMFAAKGMGKGADFPHGGAPGANPWEAMIQNCFASHAGAGALGGQMQNPMQQMLGAMLAKGAGKGKGCWPSEMSPQGGYAAPGQNEAQGANDTNVETSTHVTPESTAPGSEATLASRTAFEESVNDLVNMGLVADSQTARELLTTHGDISTVVAILTEG